MNDSIKVRFSKIILLFSEKELLSVTDDLFGIVKEVNAVTKIGNKSGLKLFLIVNIISISNNSKYGYLINFIDKEVIDDIIKLK